MRVYMGKRPEQRRAEAVERMRGYAYKRSKAKRKGTASPSEWAERTAQEIERLSR